jgi:uncharacterized repeat protein (TIGR01451 family)
MKTHQLLKILSPFLGLGLVVGLLIFLGNSSAGAQGVTGTPVPPPVSTDDTRSPFKIAAAPEMASPLAPEGVYAANANDPLLTTLRWTSPYSESTTDLAWGDYDLDGDLDLLVANGINGSNRLFRNNGGSFTFVTTIDCASTNENTSSVTWYDYDLDGYLDITIGNDSGLSCFYQNNRNDTFTRKWLAQLPQKTSSVAWAGWTDTTGELQTYLAIGNYGQISAVYLRDVGQMFPYTFPKAYNTTSLAWGDYDNDGDPDLAMGNFGGPTIVFRNDPPTPPALIRLTPVVTITKDATSSYFTNHIAWGDVNGDGRLDLALGNGYDSGRYDPDKVFCNQGNNNFTDCWTSNDTSATNAIAWGDYDGDGDLDLAATSENDQGPTRIYINTNGVLADTAGGTTFNDGTLLGNAIAWADVDGDGDLELSIGYDGNIYPYPASVLIYNNTGGNFTPLDIPSSSDSTRGLAWGDANEDGFLDLAVANFGNPVKVYRSDGTKLVAWWSAPGTYNTRATAWGDYDRDGDLDLALGNSGSNVVYINNGSGLSSSTAYLVDAGSNTTAIAWGDMNGDGTLDLIEANYNTNQTNTIFYNFWRPSPYNRYELRTLVTSTFGTASDQSTSLSIGDFDQDYDLDILVGNDGQLDRVYVNQGGGSFVTISLPASSGICAPNATRAATWADWDKDGDLDIALALDGCLRVLRTDGKDTSATFTEVWNESSTSLDPTSISWGDYDGDGDPDLAVGLAGQFGLKSRIYRNTGGALNLQWVANLEELARTLALAWGDVDNDGDLDLAIGNDTTNAKPDRLYINTIIGSTSLANDALSTYVRRPDWSVLQANAWNYSAGRVVGDPVIPIAYTLADKQGDQAHRVEHQLSWDGGYTWEPAWEYHGSHSGVWGNVSSSRNGSGHVFAWDALNQILNKQGLSIPVISSQSTQDMDVAFRVVAWSNPEHGGLIQRPLFGAYTTFMRVDMRPNWFDSAKTYFGTKPTAVHPGDTLHLTVEITQTDHGLPPGAYVRDTLPPELYLPGYGLAWADSSSSIYGHEITSTYHMITWTGAIEYYYNPSLPHIYRVRFEPKVVRPLPNGLDVTNCAQIYDGLHAPFDRCLTFEISSTPKTDESWKRVNGVTSNIVLPGDMLTYTIILTNTGTDNAHSVVMTDVVPAHTVWQNTLVASSGAASYNNGLINWNGDLNVFHPVYLTYTVRVEKPLAGNTLLTNTFLLQDNINPVWRANVVQTTILAPDLRASTKTGLPKQVQLGDPVTYTIWLRNVGGLNALPAYLSDPIPAGAIYISGTVKTGGGVSVGYDSVKKQIYWRGNLLMGQPISLTFSVYAGLPGSARDGIMTNTVLITDSLGGPVTLVATTTVALPNLSGSVKLAAAGPVEIGDRITYTIAISNTGGYAPDIIATDPIPANSTFVPNSVQTSGGSIAYDASRKQVVWHSPVQKQQQLGFTYVITAGCPNNMATGVISNVVYIQDPTGFVISRTTTTAVRLPSLDNWDVSVNKVKAAPGDVVRYTITIPNTGAAGNLWLDDVLPIELEWVANNASVGAISYNTATRTIRWDGRVGTGEQAVLTIDVRIKPNMINKAIANPMELSDGCQGFEIEPAIIYVGNLVYLPLIRK